MSKADNIISEQLHANVIYYYQLLVSTSFQLLHDIAPSEWGDNFQTANIEAKLLLNNANWHNYMVFMVQSFYSQTTYLRTQLPDFRALAEIVCENFFSWVWSEKVEKIKQLERDVIMS